jgi:hypothetical protein
MQDFLVPILVTASLKTCKRYFSHRKIPDGLTGLDRDVTWSYSCADGWVYGHGTFSLVSHQRSVVGLFQWMPNSVHEAKRL